MTRTGIPSWIDALVATVEEDIEEARKSRDGEAPTNLVIHGAQEIEAVLQALKIASAVRNQIDVAEGTIDWTFKHLKDGYTLTPDLAANLKEKSDLLVTMTELVGR